MKPSTTKIMNKSATFLTPVLVSREQFSTRHSKEIRHYRSDQQLHEDQWPDIAQSAFRGVILDLKVDDVES